ncbi:unnamed protein product [Caenorhabditis nigoni]
MSLDPNTTSPTPPQCASELQMFQRNSNVFRANVLFNFIVESLTLWASVAFCLVLYKRSFFSKSCTFLIYVNLIVINLHQWNYAFIQGWSLQRALVHSDQPCSIMFTEYECFQWYTNSIFSRLLLLFMSCALTLDNFVTLLIPRLTSSYASGIMLSFAAVLAAFAQCSYMTRDGPNSNIQSNCFQRLNRDIGELKMQIYMYLIVVAVCVVLNAILLITKYLMSKITKANYDVNDKIEKKEAVNTAGAISIVVMCQMVFSTAYTISVVYLINNGKDFDPRYLSNFVLWCYTYTLSAFSFPVGLLIFTRVILNRRHQSITTMRNQTETIDSHFEKLGKEWGCSPPTRKITPIEK